MASKTEDTSSELKYAVALLVLLALNGLWYAGIYLIDNFGTAVRHNLPLILTLLAIAVMVQGWEVLKRLAGTSGRSNLV